jgi:hypothetical protein
MYFLDRSDLYETVKPYSFQYVLEADFPLHNLELSLNTTRIHSMRKLIPDLSLDVQGFEVHKLRTSMRYEDFRDPQKIQSVYVSELEEHLKRVLGATSVRGLDYQVSTS